MCISIVLLLAAVVFTVSAAAPLPAPRHIFINVANDAGVKYNWDAARYGGPDNTYYIKADGGGLNELHVTNDVSAAYGQVSTTNDVSGTFYFSNTGGRGYDNIIVLLVSVKGPLPDDFALHIRSSGYNWTAAPPGAYTPTELPSDYSHIVGAVDEVFTKSDFIYGEQTWKPGPGDPVIPSLPLYYGQDINDASTGEYLMFVDLYVGNMQPSTFGTTLIDNGAAKVEFRLHQPDHKGRVQRIRMVQRREPGRRDLLGEQGFRDRVQRVFSGICSIGTLPRHVPGENRSSYRP